MHQNPPEFERILQPFRRALARLRLDFDFFLQESGPLTIASIESRVKSFDSASHKSQELGIDIQKLDDLAGIRVVCGTEVDVRAIAHFAKDGLRGTSFNTVKDRNIERDCGYRARHIVIEVPEDYTGTWASCRVEFQIQTVLQSAFNRLSRNWLYKSGRKLSDSTLAKFSQFSEELKTLDAQATDLQLTIFQNPSQNRDDDALTELGLRSLVLEYFDEDIDDENAIYSLLFYRRIGIETCGQLRSFFGREEIAEFFLKCQGAAYKDNALLSLAKTKHDFWVTIGTRMPDVCEAIEKLNAIASGGSG